MIGHVTHPIRFALLVAAVLLLFAAAGGQRPAFAADFTVDNTADVVDANPGDGVCDDGAGNCTLRAAIQEVNALAGVDTITLPAGTYTLTIVGTGEDAAATGDLDITADATIIGTGAASTSIDGNGLDRVLHVVGTDTVVRISGVTIRDGDAGLGDGGGIMNNGALTLNGVALSENSALNGGGIANAASATLAINDSTIDHDTADAGGGIHNAGSGTLTNVTISGNEAGYDDMHNGAGIHNTSGATMALTNVTMTDWFAIFNPVDGTVAAKNTIVLGYCMTPGRTDRDLSANITNLGNNLTITHSATCPFDACWFDGNLVFPLAWNGGSTRTQAVFGCNVDGAAAAACPATDQRGISRPQHGACDIGAYEARVVAGDYDGDLNDTDIAVWRPSGGTWYVRNIFTRRLGAPGDIPVPAAYFGWPSGSPGFGYEPADIAVWRPSNGVWYIESSSKHVTFGISGDIPVPGDYNGTYSANQAVWRPSNGTWHVRGVGVVPWGWSGDIPVPGDYNGNGRTNIAVWRPSDGTWYIRGMPKVQWGQPGDIPVPGDYDGDAKVDIAVWRPSNGTWYVRNVANVKWGRSGDTPVPGDYDGNGRTNIAVWRTSNGTWYIRGMPKVQWGQPGDIPVPGTP